MKTSIEGRAALAASEGVVPAVYLDSVNVPTFGIGVTHWAIGEEAFSRLPDAMPQDINAAVDLALDMFDRVLPQYEAVVNDAIEVSLEQHEYDALVHFAYNIGGPNFRRSRLVRLLNAGNKKEAGRVGFHGWLKPPELRGRRDHEADMFLHGNYGGSAVPVYATNGKRRLGGRVKAIPRATVVQMMQTPAGGYPSQIVPPVAPRQPAKKVPEEVMELIAETGGEKSKTDLLNSAVQWLMGGGLVAVLPNIKGILQEVDPIVVGAAIVGAAVVFAVATYSRGSRKRKGSKSQAALMSLVREGLS